MRSGGLKERVIVSVPDISAILVLARLSGDGSRDGKRVPRRPLKRSYFDQSHVGFAVAPSQFAGIASLYYELIPSGVGEQSAASQQGEEPGRGRDSPAHRDLLQPGAWRSLPREGGLWGRPQKEKGKKGRREARRWITSGWASESIRHLGLDPACACGRVGGSWWCRGLDGTRLPESVAMQALQEPCCTNGAWSNDWGQGK
ncbi:hypothetical protein J3F83DRAFT_256478 [Trichoderma novae-zelandiae]